MRNLLRFFTLAAFLATLPVANASNVTGIWKGSFDFDGTTVPLTFHLTSSDGMVTGTVEGLPTSPTQIHQGKLTSTTLTFSVNSDYQGENYTLICTGTLLATGRIDLHMGTDDGSWSTELTATRSAEAVSAPASANVTGIWTGSFDFNGTTVALIFHLTSSDGVVTGTVEGLPTSPTQIHQGKLTSTTLTFSVNTDYQGESYTLICTGTLLAPGRIDLNLGTDDGSWSTELIATKNA